MAAQPTPTVREPTFDPESKTNPLLSRRGAEQAYSKEADKPFNYTRWSKDKGQFHWVYNDEPHRTRRAEILAAHPEIRQLFGPEPLTLPIVLALTLSQVWIASWISSQPWYIIFLTMYLFGATANHALQLANHEISHNLAFEELYLNLALGVFANFATAMPSSVTFRYYHMDHHQYQGVDVIDTDIPTDWELSFFTDTPRKLVWMSLQWAAYAFRPMVLNPKPLTREQIVNGAAVIMFDAWVAYTFGIGALAYLAGSTLLGIGLHPCAGHFVAEHYEFVKGYETYSYYGICNYFNFNVGYHNEHHDFPKIAWSRLPMVRRIAPEWYEHLPHHDNYSAVIFNYITDPEIGPWSRVKRKDGRRKKTD